MQQSEWLGPTKKDAREIITETCEKYARSNELSLCVVKDVRVIDMVPSPVVRMHQVIFDAMEDPSKVFLMFTDYKDGFVVLQNLHLVASCNNSHTTFQGILGMGWQPDMMFVRGDRLFTTTQLDFQSVLREVCNTPDFTSGSEGESMECMVCCHSFDCASYFFECKHLFCVDCTAKLAREKPPTCPLCRCTGVYAINS